MSEKEQTHEPERVNRRDFVNNAAKIGIGGAVALFLGIKSRHEAAADTCHFVSQQTRYSAPCGPAYHNNSCWFYMRCTSGYSYWYRAYCGACAGNP
jgi:hypothetical protein